MTMALSLLYRVVLRRVRAGEGLEEVSQAYPKLTKEERAQVRLLIRNRQS